MSTRRFMPLCLLLLIAIGGCGSDDPTGPGLTPNGTMTAVIDGTTWTAVQVVAQRTGTFISVGGSDTGPTGIGFAMVESGTGTFTILGAEATTANVTTTATTWTAGTGQVTFTTLTSERAAGTFSFVADLTVGTGAATRTVTNGVFDVTF